MMAAAAVLLLAIAWEAGSGFELCNSGETMVFNHLHQLEL